MTQRIFTLTSFLLCLYKQTKITTLNRHQVNKKKKRDFMRESGQNSCAFLPFRLGNGVDFSLAALLGRLRFDRLKLVPWFL